MVKNLSTAQSTLAFARLAVGPPAWWAATSNVEVGQLTQANPANRRRGRRGGGQSHKEEEREGESGLVRGLWILC